MKPDLNLLAVFDAVALTGSVTAAAVQLGLSQPAVSHALNRLRSTVGDPLFTRSGRGLVPTPTAQAMLAPVRDVLITATALLAPKSFSPDSDRSVFRIGASDYAALVLVPALARLVQSKAPLVTLEIVPTGRETLHKLAGDELDASFWGTEPPDKPFHYEPVFQERYIGVARAGHPIFAAAINGKTPLLAFLDYPHAVVSMGDPGVNQIDKALQLLGKTRRVGLSSHSFAGNIASLGDSDYITNLPSKLGRVALGLGLRVFDLPVKLPPYAYGFVWHHRTHMSPKHQWLREMIALAASEQNAAANWGQHNCDTAQV
jgi:DNA-binding transcriptional LysR family regulator